MKRVVITGMGVVSPIGNDVPSFQKALEEGVIGIGPITKVDEPESPIKLAAEVKNYNPEAAIPKKDIKRLDLFSQYALSAADEAVKSSGLDLEAVDSHRMGVIISSGIGGMETFENEVIKFHEKGGFKIAPLFIPMMIGNMAAGNVALEYGCKGICTNVVTACAASTHAIGEAFRNIKHGYCDVILAGGTEAAVTKAAVAGFSALKALSRSDDPLRGSIPFDAERDGFVIGEGAGILVLESLDHAQERGATILGEIVGYGANCDAYHITAPSPGGEGASACMSLALAEAGIDPNEVQYINAHGTSTQLNDAAESAAIERTFGEHSKDLLVSSSKSQFGHLLGAAGAVESIALLTGMNKGFAPATMGYKVQDEVCNLNYVPNAIAKANIKYAMSNNFGFGGHNASLCFKKWEE